MEKSFTLHAPWETVKSKLKEKNINLTDDDLQFQEGEEQQLVKRLESKLNLSEEEIIDYIESVSANRGSAE